VNAKRPPLAEIWRKQAPGFSSFGTDCFDGEKTQPYLEEDEHARSLMDHPEPVKGPFFAAPGGPCFLGFGPDRPVLSIR
jgi:hypothetical protein